MLTLTRCGGTAAPRASGVPTQGGAAVAHVAVVVLENTNYSAVIGSPSMPYLNGLASQYGLATNYFANTHPSIGNYFMLTTGQLITNDDGFSGVVSADNLARELNNLGKTWKAYAEGIPQPGYLGGDASWPSTTVLVHESLSHHGMNANVVFMDLSGGTLSTSRLDEALEDAGVAVLGVALEHQGERLGNLEYRLVELRLGRVLRLHVGHQGSDVFARRRVGNQG